MKRKEKKFKDFLKKYWIEICLLFITPIIVSLLGINEFPILQDLGFFSYIGQELLRGEPIYSTVFIKPPLVGLFFAFSMGVFNFLPQYFAIRVFMLIVISLLVLLFYRVILKIFNDKMISVLSVLIFISFTFFVELSLLGDSKTLALFFCFLTFALLFRKYYLLSGMSACFCFFFWQPIGIFLVAPLIFSFLENNKRKVKIKNFIKTLLGFSIPLIFLIVYFSSYSSVTDIINFSLIYPLKYESSSITTWSLWAILNIFGYYCSEFFFLVLGFIGLLYFFYKIIKIRFWTVSHKNKYLTSFVLSFFLLSLALFKDFDDGSDLTVLLPAVSVLAAFVLKKIHGRFTGIVSKKTATIFLILIVCIYGFFPILQPVYPENPVIRDRDKYIWKTSPLELISSVQKEHGILNSFLLFLFHRKGEQITIEHQLEVAKIIQDGTEENEKILCLSSPEILFLSERKNMNPYPLFERGFKQVSTERGEFDKMREDVMELKPKFILANDESFIKNLELTEFIEKNYEKLPLDHYGVYKYVPKN